MLLSSIAVGFPLMLGLLFFLVFQSVSTASKMEKLTDQVAAMRGDYARLAEQMDRVERAGRP